MSTASTPLTQEELIQIALAAVPEVFVSSMRSYLVERLDGGNAYYLVKLSDNQTLMAMVRIEEGTGRVLGHLRLAGSHTVFSVNELAAIKLAGIGTNAKADLVWFPSKVSMSPFLPIWRVRNAEQTVYVDQAGTRWSTLPAINTNNLV